MEVIMSSNKASRGYGSFIRIAPPEMDWAPRFRPMLLALWFFGIFHSDLHHLANDQGISNLAFWALEAAVYLACAFLPMARDVRKGLILLALIYVPCMWASWHWILKRA